MWEGFLQGEGELCFLFLYLTNFSPCNLGIYLEQPSLKSTFRGYSNGHSKV